jgi:hypothetical protein
LDLNPRGTYDFLDALVALGASRLMPAPPLVHNARACRLARCTSARFNLQSIGVDDRCKADNGFGMGGGAGERQEQGGNRGAHEMAVSRTSAETRNQSLAAPDLHTNVLWVLLQKPAGPDQHFSVIRRVKYPDGPNALAAHEIASIGDRIGR